MPSLPRNRTKLNLLTVVFVFALFGAFVSPSVLEYSAWRWYVFGALVVFAGAALFAHRKVAAFEAVHKNTAAPVRSARVRRIISGAGIAVIGPIVAMLLRDSSIDKEMLGLLIGYFITCVVMFASTFSKRSKDPRAGENA